MKTKFFIKILTFAFLVIAIQSCSKTSNSSELSQDGATVKVVATEIEFENMEASNVDNNTGAAKLAASTAKGSTSTQPDLIGIQSFGADKTIEVYLSKDASNQTDLKNTAANNSIKKVAAIERKPLAKGVQYKILIYDATKKLVAERLYTYGTESTAPGITLDAGKKYTFIGVSVNSTTAVPTVTNSDQLDKASVANISADLLFFKKELTLTHGLTNLSVILKHKYSLITAILRMDENTTGAFTAVSNPYITPTNQSASLKFSDEVISYNTPVTQGVEVKFPSITGTGLRTLTAAATLVINPTTGTGTIKFASITVDGETKTNVSIPNIKITPGVKYNLILNFKTCTSDVSTNSALNWNYDAYTNSSKVTGILKNGVFIPNNSILEQTIKAPGGDYGFVFDITEMDNSFNMELNGVKLAKNEIQFEVNSTLPQNIRFKDLSLYQGINITGGTVPPVYNQIGTLSMPIVKVVISRTGVVTMYGSKVSGGPLFELELYNGNSFNTFIWNDGTHENNDVKITQMVLGKTTLKGVGSGKKKIKCN